MLFAWSAFLFHTSAASRFAFLFLLIAVSHFYVECQQVPISQNKVSICADEYKVSSYTLECQVGLGIVIRGAIEVFARQSTGVFPDCFAQGYNYNYSKPFLDYCDAKNICTLSSAFLDENRLFDPEPYYLPDKSFYLKPFRIDVFYDCSSSPLLPTLQLPVRVNQITTTTTSTTTTTKTTTMTTTTKKPTTTSITTTTTQTTTITSTTTILTTSTTKQTTITADNMLTTTSKDSSKLISNINSITTSSLSPVLTTTRIENLGGDNTTTDRTVMIVLIVLGAIFFLIIIAIVVLICLRRRNQKRMDKEFGGFRSEKNGGGASSLNNNASSASISNMGGGVKEKVPFTITDTAFIEVSQSTSVRNYENSTETHGTYRSRNNNGYDSTADEPNSMSRVRLTTATIAAETSLPRQPQQQQVVNPGPKNRPRVDHDEYWRTNI